MKKRVFEKCSCARQKEEYHSREFNATRSNSLMRTCIMSAIATAHSSKSCWQRTKHRGQRVQLEAWLQKISRCPMRSYVLFLAQRMLPLLPTAQILQSADAPLFPQSAVLASCWSRWVFWSKRVLVSNCLIFCKRLRDSNVCTDDLE
jgi:hypothetical protein